MNETGEGLKNHGLDSIEDSKRYFERKMFVEQKSASILTME